MPRCALPSPPNSFGLPLRSSAQMSSATSTSETNSAATIRQKFHASTRPSHDHSPLAPGAVFTATPSPERKNGWVKSNRSSRSAVIVSAPMLTSSGRPEARSSNNPVTVVSRNSVSIPRSAAIPCHNSTLMPLQEPSSLRTQNGGDSIKPTTKRVRATFGACAGSWLLATPANRSTAARTATATATRELRYPIATSAKADSITRLACVLPIPAMPPTATGALCPFPRALQLAVLLPGTGGAVPRPWPQRDAIYAAEYRVGSRHCLHGPASQRARGSDRASTSRHRGRSRYGDRNGGPLRSAGRRRNSALSPLPSEPIAQRRRGGLGERR